MEYVIRKHIVARSLARLRAQRTHTLFAGYLYLQQRSSELNRLNDLQPDFTSYFRKFFRVGNHPLGTPYIKIFTEQKSSDQNLWLNENVAGSYAPSSLRPEQPFRKVVSIVDRKYSLPTDHAKRAFEYLLYSDQVQVADVAVVLYRDFGFFDDSLTINSAINIFAYEFGYSLSMGAEFSEDFQTLFSLENSNDWEEDWLEAL